MTKVENVI